jgi:hypothetical protein
MNIMARQPRYYSMARNVDDPLRDLNTYILQFALGMRMSEESGFAQAWLEVHLNILSP